MNTKLLSPCNYYCSNCIIFRRGKCLGCVEASEKALVEGRAFCDIALCAKDKKMVTCSDCKSYPCEKYNDGIFAESFIKWIRNKVTERSSAFQGLTEENANKSFLVSLP